MVSSNNFVDRVEPAGDLPARSRGLRTLENKAGARLNTLNSIQEIAQCGALGAVRGAHLLLEYPCKLVQHSVRVTVFSSSGSCSIAPISPPDLIMPLLRRHTAARVLSSLFGAIANSGSFCWGNSTTVGFWNTNLDLMTFAMARYPLDRDDSLAPPISTL